MIQIFVDRFMAAKSVIEAEIKAQRPEDYDALVRRVVEIVGTKDPSSDEPDPLRITVIDHGSYQGTRLYIIGAAGYQPRNYWSIFVDYGSCSGCDTLESIRNYSSSSDPVTDQQLTEYWTLMLHMVQQMRPLKSSEEL